MSNLGPGDFVKIRRDGQRLWFCIERIDGAAITARLDNEPATEIEWQPGVILPLPIQPSLKLGQLITFDFNEVIDVLPGARP